MTIHLSIVLFLPLACGLVSALLPPRLGRSAVLAGPLLVLGYVIVMLVDFESGGGLQWVTDDEWISRTDRGGGRRGQRSLNVERDDPGRRR